MASGWFVYQARPGQSDVASYHLKRQGFEPYEPTAADDGRRLFPGYGLLELDLDFDDWKPINSTRGVLKLLPKHLEMPGKLPEGFVEDLRRNIDSYVNAMRTVDHWVKGDVVPVASGKFVGVSGSLVVRQKGCLVLLISLLGRKTRVSVPAHQCSSPPSPPLVIGGSPVPL